MIANPHLSVLIALTTLIALSLSQGYVDSLTDASAYWRYSTLLDKLQGLCALWLLFIHVPYKRLFLKTIIGVWTAAASSEVLIYTVWLTGFTDVIPMTWAKTVLLSVSVLYITFKSYSLPSDPIEPGYIYQVRVKPRGLQDFLLSLIYWRPFGGTGVICGEG